MALLAETIDAAEAHALGLVTWVDAGEIDAFVVDVANRLAAGPPIALAHSKALLNEGVDRTMRDALANEAHAQIGNFATVDSAEAYAAFAENVSRRSPGNGRSRDRSKKMRETVIVEAVRTPVGKRNGGLSTMHAADLSAVVLNELVMRTGIDPDIVDDVVLGCVSRSATSPATSVVTRCWRQAGPRASGHHDQPGLRVQPAGARLRGASGDVRSAGRRGGRRGRGDEPGAAGFCEGKWAALRSQSA